MSEHYILSTADMRNSRKFALEVENGRITTAPIEFKDFIGQTLDTLVSVLRRNKFLGFDLEKVDDANTDGK